jgi:ATP-dependent helicase/nuclease subunit A
VVRSLDDVPGAAAVNEQQIAAIDARGHVFVSAGAGTGKTSVLVERFVRSVCEEGLDVESSLVITYTERAAAELRARIRAALVERDRPDLSRALDGAWISTIHGFCHRLLRANPFAAGLDPRFRVLDESQGRVLRSEAFEAALTTFCAGGDPERLKLLATYGAAGLRTMLAGVYETLRSAGRELSLELGSTPPSLVSRYEELREAARCLVDDGAATELQRTAAAEALELPPGAERLLDLSGVRARGERAASYEEARRAVERAALEELAARDRELLEELLQGFALHYGEAKARESALDFEDLQLFARELVREEPIRDSLRFRRIMVDEFQDTNRLQTDIVDAIPSEEVFVVGDEFQSIYGFRHADVGVFRERRDRAGEVLPLTQNYRSRPEVLAAVNHLFEAEFGDRFQPLAASGAFETPVLGHPVELLVTDKASYRDSGEHWRRAEAKAVSRRVRQLVDEGAATPGEIVLLFAAGTDAEWYEEELRRVGLPTIRALGRGYYGQQQVVDLLAYLRLLHNRYDDEALATVLASPFVGLSNDGLVLVRRAASRRPLFSGIERTLPPGLSDEDGHLLQAFLQRYERLAGTSLRLSLERLCEQIVSEHDYDLAVLVRWDGRRRYANLRKLMRLARSYEELRGPDIEGFVRFVREQEAVGARELEAVAEEEGADAVRLLTIHAAKGLEFKVVVVADAGRDRNAPSADEILALADGRFGFRVVNPETARREPVFDYEEVKKTRAEEERAERLRLYYVAMTRAIDRLIVSGSIDLEKDAERTTPIGWVLDRLDAAEDMGGEVNELVRGDARFLVRMDRFSPQPPAEPEAAAEEGQLALFAEIPVAAPRPTAPELPPLEPVPSPLLHVPRRLSFTALAQFDSCSYKYYAMRVAGMAERPVEGSGGGGLAATEIGDAVHRLLELTDLASPVPPDLEQVRGWYPRITDEELERVRGLVTAYCESDTAQLVAGLDGVYKERHFTFEHDGVLLHGFLDVFHADARRALVLDYKTNSLAEAAPGEIVERDYRLQRLVYALACFRAGLEEVEVIYHFLERADAAVSSVFTRAELPALEQELTETIDRIRAGDFRPTPSEFSCSGCPALDLVCAGPRLRSAPRAVLAAATV